MTPSAQVIDPTAVVAVEDRVRRLGLILLPAMTLPTEKCMTDRLRRLLTGSPLVRQAIGSLREQWSEQRLTDPVQPFAGLRLYPIVIPRRRRPVLSAILAIPTLEIVESEFLHALCQSARLDLESTRTMILSLPPAHPGECDRLAALVRNLVEDETRIESASLELESIGRELGESYEEINLLYGTIRNMTVVEQPDRFVATVADELFETLSFRWIAVVLQDDTDRLKRMSGRSIFAGDGPPPSVIRRFLRDLAASGEDRGSFVVDARDPGSKLADGLGASLLVQPIIGSDEALLGHFVAGEKTGDGARISSSDLKLLAATAGHAAIFLENAALYDDLNATIVGTLEALTASIDAKDPYTFGHSRRVALLTRDLAAATGLPEEDVAIAHKAGLVHDVGKIGVPEAVLTKPGRLTEEEFAWIRRHPEIGHRILRDIPHFRPVLPGVLHHHERWDGRGYPSGLAGEQIPRIARLIALADSFDAMSSNRTYRSRLSRAEVLAEVQKCAGSQFDPDLVPAFLALDFSEFDRVIDEHMRRDGAGAAR